MSSDLADPGDVAAPAPDGTGARGPSRRVFIALLAGGVAGGAGVGYALRGRPHSGGSHGGGTPGGDDRATLYFSSGNAVYALSAATGRVRWTRPLNSETTIAVGSGRVFTVDYFGTAYALDGRSGAVRWTRTLTTHGSNASMSSSGDRVYVMPGDGHTYALDAATGRPLWNRQTGSPAGGPVAYQDLVFAGSPDSQVLALDAGTGEVRWTAGQPNPAATAGALTVVQGILYAAGSSTSYAIDPHTGRVLDKFTAPLLPAANGMAYYAGQDGTSMQAWNLATRQVVWTLRLPGAQYGPVTVGRSLAFLGIVNNNADECCTRSNADQEGWAGRISAYAAATGHSAWTYPAPEGDFSPPLVTSGIVYIVGNFNAYALNATTGKPLWVTPTTQEIIPGNLEIAPTD
jgi:outer membrane protein assembly factor BamB